MSPVRRRDEEYETSKQAVVQPVQQSHLLCGFPTEMKMITSAVGETAPTTFGRLHCNKQRAFLFLDRYRIVLCRCV